MHDTAQRSTAEKRLVVRGPWWFTTSRAGYIPGSVAPSFLLYLPVVPCVSSSPFPSPSGDGWADLRSFSVLIYVSIPDHILWPFHPAEYRGRWRWCRSVYLCSSTFTTRASSSHSSLAQRRANGFCGRSGLKRQSLNICIHRWIGFRSKHPYTQPQTQKTANNEEW